jgi:NADPH:quinone reductase-like Zn-dependent oxidoreductase
MRAHMSWPSPVTAPSWHVSGNWAPTTPSTQPNPTGYQARSALGGDRADVLDNVGGPVGEAAFAAIAPGGRFSAHGTPSGRSATIDSQEAKRRNIGVSGIRLINALGHPPVTRVRARIAAHDGKQICRVDVARHSEPVWAKTSEAEGVLFARFNNSTLAAPVGEADAYASLRWPA